MRGPESPLAFDGPAWAHTSPVYVKVGGQTDPEPAGRRVVHRLDRSDAAGRRWRNRYARRRGSARGRIAVPESPGRVPQAGRTPGRSRRWPIQEQARNKIPTPHWVAGAKPDFCPGATGSVVSRDIKIDRLIATPSLIVPDRKNTGGSIDVQCHHTLVAQFLGGHPAELAAVAGADHPLVQVRVIHHKYDLDLDASSPRNARCHTATPCPTGPRAASPRRSTGARPRATTSKRPAPGPGRTAARVPQSGVELHAALPLAVGIDLAVEPVHPLQPRLQLLGRVAGPGLAPAVGRPLRPLDDPVLLGAPGGSSASRPPARSPTATTRWGSRPTNPTGRRCRPGGGPAAPTAARPGGVCSRTAVAGT